MCIYVIEDIYFILNYVIIDKVYRAILPTEFLVIASWESLHVPHWQRDAQSNTVTYTCIPSTWGGEAEGSEFKVIFMLLNDSYLKGQPGIHELLSQERKKRFFSNLTAWVWKLVDKIIFSDCIPSVGKSIVKLFCIKWHCEFTLVAFGLAHVEERWRQHLHASVSTIFWVAIWFSWKTDKCVDITVSPNAPLNIFLEVLKEQRPLSSSYKLW